MKSVVFATSILLQSYAALALTPMDVCEIKTKELAGKVACVQTVQRIQKSSFLDSTALSACILASAGHNGDRETSRCLQEFSGKTFQFEAAGACARFPLDLTFVNAYECYNAIANHVFQPVEIQTCGQAKTKEQMAGCFRRFR
ncbi:MAG: hypothetical protein K2X47_12535 [Bdellovibrionales bacterium]|nr:hypothetical protein [Bdellovibrionales bacterium]